MQIFVTVINVLANILIPICDIWGSAVCPLRPKPDGKAKLRSGDNFRWNLTTISWTTMYIPNKLIGLLGILSQLEEFICFKKINNKLTGFSLKKTGFSSKEYSKGFSKLTYIEMSNNFNLISI